MIRRTLWHSLPALPLAALGSHGLPWESIIVLVCMGPFTYICRLVLLYRLAKKALEKVPPARAPEVITAITGRGTAQPTKPAVGFTTSRARRTSSEAGPSYPK